MIEAIAFDTLIQFTLRPIYRATIGDGRFIALKMTKNCVSLKKASE